MDEENSRSSSTICHPSPFLWLVIGLFIALASLYSLLIPPFETPDEIWHYAFIQQVASGRGLPEAAPNTQALWRQQGVQAPAYYLAAAALTAWIDQSDFPTLYARINPHAAIGEPGATNNRNFLIHHAEEGWPWRGSVLALHLARLFSVALGGVTLWASWQALALVLGPQLALGGVAVFAFIPQFIFITAAASNDNAVNALAGLVLWRLVAMVCAPDGHTAPRNLFWAGVLLGLALLTKLSALALVGVAGLAVVIAAARQRRPMLLLEAGLWMGIPALAIAGWWYGRNWLLYGDPLAWNIWQANILLRVETATWATIIGELGGLERSFWGLFGWLNLPYPDLVYLLLRGLVWMIALGVVIATVRWLFYSRRITPAWWGGLLLLVWLAGLTVSWLRFMVIAPAAQGRYFFPAAPSLALLIALGLGGWRIWTLPWLVAAGLFLLSLFTPFWLIAPAYALPPTHAELAPTLIPVQATLDNGFTITGVAAQPDWLAPGAQVTVTVAWRADAPPSIDYSVFVHLVDDEGFIVAQRDTMPGRGLRPTSQWDPGETRVEQYVLTVPAMAYTPVSAHYAVGMYDAANGVRVPLRIAPDTSAAAQADTQVAVQDNALVFGSVRIAAPPGAIPNPLAADFQDNMTLAGYMTSGRVLHPGAEVAVTLYWRSRGPISKPYTAFVHLLDAEYQMKAGDDRTPQPPSDTWVVGQVVEDTHYVTLPADIPSGEYRLEIGLYGPPDDDRLTLVQAAGAEGADRILLGPLRVVAGE